MADTQPELDAWPSRQWTVPPSKRMPELLTDLDEHERNTRPENQGSQVGKDLAAFQALNDAAWLMQSVAGWAIDHQVGLAAEGLEFAALGTDSLRDHPGYAERQARVDQHEHERTGGAMRDGPMPPTVARKALYNILRGMRDVFPDDLYRQTMEGLQALDTGEPTPIFRPSKTTAHIRFRLLQLQLRAIGYAEFWEKRENRSDKAWDRIVKEYGGSAQTARRWPAELRQSLGDLEVSDELFRAENAAAVLTQAEEDIAAAANLPANGPVTDFPAAERARAFVRSQMRTADLIKSQYGLVAIKRDGEAYRRIRKTGD